MDYFEGFSGLWNNNFKNGRTRIQSECARSAGKIPFIRLFSDMSNRKAKKSILKEILAPSLR